MTNLRQKLRDVETFKINHELNVFSEYKGTVRVFITTVGLVIKEDTKAILNWGDYLVHATSAPKVHVRVMFRDGKECFTTVNSYSNITVTSSGKLVEHLFEERG